MQEWSWNRYVAALADGNDSPALQRYARDHEKTIGEGIAGNSHKLNYRRVLFLNAVGDSPVYVLKYFLKENCSGNPSRKATSLTDRSD